MNKKSLFVLWGALFILTAILGFFPGAWWYTAVSVLFFLPPMALLYRSSRETVKLIRNLSALSLSITLIALILNFIFAVSSETLGNVLHVILTIVSAPMMASGYWVLSLFLWACLLMASLRELKKQM